MIKKTTSSRVPTVAFILRRSPNYSSTRDLGALSRMAILCSSVVSRDAGGLFRSAPPPSQLTARLLFPELPPACRPVGAAPLPPAPLPPWSTRILATPAWHLLADPAAATHVALITLTPATGLPDAHDLKSAGVVRAATPIRWALQPCYGRQPKGEFQASMICCLSLFYVIWCGWIILICYVILYFK